jgi:hypothetical protein
VTFGDNGVVVDEIGRTHTVSVKGARYQRMLKDGFVYFVTVPIKKPGAYQLRIAVWDHGSERVGSASQFIEVPDVKKNRLTLSSMVLTELDAETLKQATSGAADSANQPATTGRTEGEETTDPRKSAAVRQFQRGHVMSYGIVVYNAHLDKATGHPQLQTQVRLFHDGKPLFTGKELPYELENPIDLKRLAASGAIQLSTTMEPGEYVLQIIVTDLLADQKHRVASQWMDFEVTK